MYKQSISIIFFVVLLSGFVCNAVDAAPSQDMGIYLPWRFKQIDSPWEDDYYAGKPEKPFRVHGCLVTALSLLFNYHGLQHIPDTNNNYEPIINPLCNASSQDPSDYWSSLCLLWGLYVKNDPGSLNKWFTENNVYIHSGTRDVLIPEAAVKKFWIRYPYTNTYNSFVVPEYSCQPVSSGSTCYEKPWSADAERLLDIDILNKNPDLMGIRWQDRTGGWHDPHFVLVGGYSSADRDYRVYDPGRSLGRNDMYPPALNRIYPNNTHEKFRINRFKSENYIYPYSPNMSCLYAAAFSPVEIQFIAPDGKATGYSASSSEKVAEVPYSNYGIETEAYLDGSNPSVDQVKKLFIDKPREGNYILKLIGTGEGPYTIKMQGMKSDGSTNLDTSITGTASPSRSETYRITYSPTGEASLSQTNQTPIANAGSNQTGEQSYEITLDGSASSDPDGDPMKYTWNFISRPPNSAAALSNPNVQNPTFTPDLPGTYTLQLVVNDYFTDSEPSTVTITATPVQSRISVTPNFSSPLNEGPGFISFDVNNIGRVGVSSGTINISLADPDGQVVSTGSQAFSIGVGQTATISVPVSIPSLKFGNYTLTYTQSDETRAASSTFISIPNSVSATFSFEKTSYRVRETANLTLRAINTGKFHLNNLSLSVSVPDAGFSETKTISAEQNTPGSTQNYAVALPGAMTAGQHNVNAMFTLSSGSSLTQASKLVVPNSTLIISYAGPTAFSAGDMIPVTIENAGGVDTSYTTDKIALKDVRGVEIILEAVAGTLMSGEIKSLNVQVPSQTANGYFVLSVIFKDTKTGNLSSVYKEIYVNGVTANITARTDKDVYLNSESITALSTVATNILNIENGLIDIKVVKPRPDIDTKFVHFLPRTGWVFMISPNGLAVGSDGYIYVADTNNYRIQKIDSNGNVVKRWGSYGSGNGQFNGLLSVAVASDGSVYALDAGNRIQKFDSNGNFIAKWGSYGSGDGQLNNPAVIAVAPDGSVLVADTSNNRVQKFDSNGNFIAKWGSSGTADGQFKYPHGIAVSGDGSVYVADNWNHRIQKFTGNGSFITKWGSYCKTDLNGDGVPDQACDGQFYYPRAISVGPGDYVYVADSSNNRIQKFDSNGSFITKWGSYGNNDGQFKYPVGLSIGSADFLYVVDGHSRIQKFDSKGMFLAKWGSSGNSDGWFYSPGGIAIAVDGSFYVADTDNHRMQKFDRSGNFIKKWGSRGSGEGQFNYPEAISISSDGSIYVADSGNDRVQKFDSNGNFIAKWGTRGMDQGQFSSPMAIAVAFDGSVYVADSGNNRVQKFDSNGSFIAGWSWRNGNWQFYFPRGIAVAPDGSVYVADTGNDRIQKFDSDGSLITKWGFGGSGDGQFYAPGGITIAPDGTVYVAEYGNNRVQKFDSNGSFIAKWGGNQDEQLRSPNCLAVAADGAVYETDGSYHSVRKMMPAGANFDVLFETTMPLDQLANTTTQYTTNIGPLDTIGKLYLQATLKNSMGQILAASEYPFTIVNGNTLLLFNIDKKVYKPGETVTITGEVRNLAAIESTNLTLGVKGTSSTGNEKTIYSETFNISAGGIHPFTTTTIADAEGTVAVVGTVTQSENMLASVVDQYEVSLPSTSISIAAPDMVGRTPFALNVELKNTGKISSTIDYQIADSSGQIIDVQQLTIQAGENKLLQYDRQISITTTYTVSTSGDVTKSSAKQVVYGEAATIQFAGQGTMPEGRVSLPVTITNTGQLDETLSVNYTLTGAGGTEARSYFIPKGGSIADTLYYNVTAGNYQLTATSQLPAASAAASFTVVKENIVTMSTAAGSQGADGLIPVTMTLANSGYNDINGSFALAVMNNDGKAVWRGEAPVSDLKSQSSGSYSISVDSAGIISGVYPVAVNLYSSSGLLLATNQSQVRVLGPIFEVTAVPASPVFTAGKQATLNFTLKNTGTAQGSTAFMVKAMDILKQAMTDSFASGEEKTYAFSFAVPEDAEEKDYQADYTLTPVLSQATKGQAAFRINEVNVNVAAALNKDAYRNGETAILTLNVSKLSQTEDGTYIAIIRYGAHHDMQSFTLSSQPATLTFNVPLTTITGERLFYGVHFESGNTIYRNSISINEALADLAADFRGAMTEDRVQTPQISRDNTVETAITVSNYGKTASTPTSLVLYDGETPIETMQVRALNPGESTDISIIWNVLGKAGDRSLRAVVDPQDAVTEYSEMNNTGIITMRVPDLTVFTDTDKDIYKIRQKVYITSTITNLTSQTTYTNLLLLTSAKDASGREVYSKSISAGSLAALASTTNSEAWSTAGLVMDGLYTITQRIFAGSNLVAESRKDVTLEKAPDFNLTADGIYARVKQGEQAVYNAQIAPFNGWNHEVSMSTDGLPAGTGVIFNPDRLVPPGEVQTTISTSELTSAGTHTWYLLAQGADEGEIVSRDLPLTLEVSAFGLETALSSSTIKQLEQAEFPLTVTALNGYEGNVNLAVGGLPGGTRLELDTASVQAPGTSKLLVRTSKYAKPGTYTITVTGTDGLVSHSLNFSLVLQPNPVIAPGIIATPGPGPQNDALVRIFSSNQQLIKEFMPFATEYGAVSASADIDGDGYDEVIVAEGPGPRNTATFKAYTRDNRLMAEYTAFSTTYGLSLAAADIDGDWKDELLVGMGPDPQNAGTIKVLKYNGSGFAEIMTQTLYAESTYGITIAAGDLDGDGKPEIMTAPGPGPGSLAEVSLWQYGADGLMKLRTFRVFEGDYGVNLAAGDIDGDGKSEIITGSSPDPNYPALVRIFRLDGGLVSQLNPYGTAHSYGANVSAGDLDGDGRDEIITGLGPGSQNEPRVKTFKSEGTETGNFMAYPSEMDYGVRVSVGRPGIGQ